MTLRVVLTIAAFAMASPVAAQDLYVGAGVDYGLPHSGDAQGIGSFIAGVTFDGGDTLGFGVEGELGQPIGDSGDRRETSRVRGMLSYEFGAVTGLASVGAVQYELGQQTFNGDTVGLGAQMSFTESLDGRFELMRDFMDDDYGTNVTTTRLGVLFQF